MEKAFSGYDDSKMTLGSIEIRGVMFNVASTVLNNVPYTHTYSPKSKVSLNLNDPSISNNSVPFCKLPFSFQVLTLDDLSLTGASWTDGLTLKWD